MLDGNGDVRITDFGIATAAADAGAELAGTPQYMAPELLAGRPASVKSDIYALGLILFEVFTGRRAYDARTIGDLKQLHDTGDGDDAVVDRARPRSGGRARDPAVSREGSGEAARVGADRGGGVAGRRSAGRRARGRRNAVAGAARRGRRERGPSGRAGARDARRLLPRAGAWRRGRQPRLDHQPLPMAVPRDALADRATQILKKLGHGNDIADRAMGFHFDSEYTRWAEETVRRRGGPTLRIGRPAALIFWYRTSPEMLAPSSPASRVNARDPPVTLPGMHQLFLDTEGRLVEFHSVPPAIALEKSAPEAPWPALFEAADLDVGHSHRRRRDGCRPISRMPRRRGRGRCPDVPTCACASRPPRTEIIRSRFRSCGRGRSRRGRRRRSERRVQRFDGRHERRDVGGDACRRRAARTSEPSRQSRRSPRRRAVRDRHDGWRRSPSIS